MRLKVITGIVLALFLTSMLTLVFNIQPVKAYGTIYIRADGSVEPSTANITSVDNVTYTFTGNVNDSIVVERDNIVVDGVGYILQGTGVWDSKGIKLTGRSNVTIENIEIKAFFFGIWLNGSSNNAISGNKLAKNWYGIYLYKSSNNSISGNNITTNNEYGIYLVDSSNSFLRNNVMVDNRFNFGVSGSTLSHFVNDVDASNTVDGKPVYYWVSERDAEVPLDAGYVALVNCTDMKVENLTLTKNDNGILLSYTNHTTVSGNNITNSAWNGIYLYYSTRNTIANNAISSNHDAGILLRASSNNTMVDNDVLNNTFGIAIWDSRANTIYNNIISKSSEYCGIFLTFWANNNEIYNNTVSNCRYGIGVYISDDNKIYHNNFVNNTKSTDINLAINTWDDGYPSGGNYWSDYAGVDLYSGPYQNVTGSDGIGDTPCVIDTNNRDHYPLMNPWTPIEYHDIDIQFAPKVSVGGNIVPVNKLELLMPYTQFLVPMLIVFSVILFTMTVVVKKRKIIH